MPVETLSDKWLRRFVRAQSPRTQLVCFPHAGGSASSLPPARALGSTADVVAVRYPDRRHQPGVPAIMDGALAWQHHATGGSELPAVPGGHFLLTDLAAEIIRPAHRRLSAAVLP